MSRPLRLTLAALLLLAAPTTSAMGGGIVAKKSQAGGSKAWKGRVPLRKPKFLSRDKRPISYREIQDAMQVVPKGERQAWAATIMVGSGVSAAKVEAAERSIPEGLFPDQRLVMGSIMAAMKVPWSKVKENEAKIPEGHWESQRGVIAVIMAARGLEYAQIKATQKTMIPGEWKDADQRIIIAAIETFSGLSHDQVRQGESTIPRALWPHERGIIGALVASFGKGKAGLSRADRQHVDRGGLLRRAARRFADGGKPKPTIQVAGEPYVTRVADIERSMRAVPAGKYRAVVAEIMARSGIAARTIQAKLDAIPAGADPDQKLLVATLMAAGDIDYAAVKEAEKQIPDGLWPTQREVVAGIIAVSPWVTYKTIAASEKTIPRGEWTENDQRITIAAVKEGFGSVTYDDVRAAEKLIPKGKWPGERSVLASHIAFFAGARKSWGLAPEDAARAAR